MSRNAFERRAEPAWRQMESLLRDLDSRSRDTRDRPAESWASLPRLFRRLCQDLALARHRHYGSKTIERLNGVALRTHKQMYAVSHRTFVRFWEFVAVDFPQAVRRERMVMLWAMALFFLPFLAMVVLIQFWPELAYSVLPAEQLAQFERMYQPGEDSVDLRWERHADSDLAMFGLYVWNNIGIGFATYGAGLAYGVGAILILFFNGFVLGTAFGHINYIGAGTAINSFAVGHGAFELTAIAIAGGAGLRLGLALIAPGRRRRGQALRIAADRTVKIIGGAGLMLLVAAFIEAFWSPRQILSPNTKYVVGAMLWAAVAAFLLLAGRRSHGS